MRTASLTERRLLSLALAFVATTLVHHRHYSQHDAADPFVKVTPPKARFVEAAAVPIALVPDARVCHGRGDNESVRSLPLAAHELVFVGGMDALLGALATRLVERSLPCGSALGADAAKSPSVKAPSAKKEPAPHRKGSSFGDLVNMARLKAQGGEAFKLEQKQYQRDRASNERRRARRGRGWGLVRCANDSAGPGRYSARARGNDGHGKPYPRGPVRQLVRKGLLSKRRRCALGGARRRAHAQLASELGAKSPKPKQIWSARGGFAVGPRARARADRPSRCDLRRRASCL